jgi:hypothetical protein
VDAELKVGSGGIFIVEVSQGAGAKIVAQRSGFGFPSEKEIVDAVQKALAP